MSQSEPATNDVPSWHTKLKKTHSWVTLVAGSVVSIVIVVFQIMQFVNTLATKQQVELLRDTTVMENIKLKQELDEAKEREKAASEQLEEVYDAVEDHLERYAGEKAADLEPDRHKAAKAAKQARENFKKARLNHKSLKEAVSATFDEYFPF